MYRAIVSRRGAITPVPVRTKKYKKIGSDKLVHARQKDARFPPRLTRHVLHIEMIQQLSTYLHTPTMADLLLKNHQT